MKEKKSSEDVQKKGRGRSLRSYASRVFQESSVGMVSSLAQTSSTKRRVFKVLALIACLTGFLYQTGTFLAFVLQYPTSVSIEIIRPDELNVPAFTFCDNNGINRRIFCEKYPENCEVPDEELCKNFEHYCDENRTLVPKKKFYSLTHKLSFEDMVDLNVNVTDFVDILIDRGNITQKVTGPHMRRRNFDHPKYLCYSVHDRVNSTLWPRNVRSQFFRRDPVIKLRFNVKPYDVYLPGTRKGILFAVHSPFEAVSPFETGIFMQPGRTYMVSVTMEEEILLQEPYDTKCVNYTEIWIQNGYSGPRLQNMCKQDCIADIAVKCHNCVGLMLYYPRNERYCEEGDFDNHTCPNNMRELFRKCQLRCREDCRNVKYSYTVQERFSQKFDEDGEFINDIDRSITVEVFLEGDEMIVWKHSPKYMFVEVFSNIGGFIGCWLGINLLDITDIFEGFFRIFRYSFKT